MDRFDVVVVGGGHNGLVASIVLAMHGARVALVEHRQSLGGLSSDSIYKGARYPRVAYSLGLFPRELARYVSVDPYRHAALTNPSWVVIEWDSGETVFRWWVDRGSLARELVLAGVGKDESKSLVGYLEAWSRCSKPVLYATSPPSLDEAKDLLDRCHEGLGDIAGKRFSEGIGSMLPSNLWGLLAYPGMEVEPGISTLLHNTNMGVWMQLPNGWSPIISEMEIKASSLGVAIFKGLGRAVIDVKNGAVEGVRVSGLKLRAGKVLYAGSILELPRALGEKADLLGSEALREMRMLSEAYIAPDRVTIVTSCKPKPLYRSAERPPLIEVWGREFWGEFSYPTLLKESRIPGERHAVVFTGFAPSDSEELLRVAGIECVDTVDSVDRNVQAIEYLNPSGHPNHIPYHGGRVLDRRPLKGWSSYTTPIEGLYHGSASSHPGGQVMGVPGHNAAVKILQDMGLKARTPLISTRT